MTKVRTRSIPKNCAVTQDVELMLILDEYGQINVIQFDNLDVFIDHINSPYQLNSKELLSLKDLVNANIIYSFAEKLGIKCGLFIEGDKFICQHLMEHMSDNILSEDKKVALDELKASWNRLVRHPMAQQYVHFGEGSQCIDEESEPLFPGMGAYEVFIEFSYGGSLNTLAKNYPEKFSLFLQFSSLLMSSLQGQTLETNEYAKVALYLHWSEKIKKEASGYCVELVSFLEQKREQISAEYGKWFVAVTGWAETELDAIADDYPQHFPLALKNLLTNSLPISEIIELNKNLTEILDYLTLPKEIHDGLYQYTLELPEAMREQKLKEAIRFALLRYAKENKLELYRSPQSQVLAPFLKAGKGELLEAQLLEYLLTEDTINELQPYECYSILRKTQNELVREIVSQKMNMNANSEWAGKFSLLRPSMINACLAFGNVAINPYIMRDAKQFISPVFSSFLPQYSRLKASLQSQKLNELNADPANLLSQVPQQDIFSAALVPSVKPKKPAPPPPGGCAFM